ncbi:hypothetical protein PR202_ga24971 [Eleusine coracana subsp. coracana]|uniref:DUF641 domain-containing protein n=1 Tax=Eleusine coracana subsp. coracana TaxID=191504 RepID=A0AAV5D9Z3_ELECO|nr:hypothetical protein PR202_ga24971 [Eleusine coracana subsp. coracana]
MESPRSARTRTPACSVPSVLVGLTKLCKLPKVCAAPAQDNDDEAATTSGPGYDQRLILVRLFEAMSTLKSAYIKLQKAHIPFDDPIKIAVADETITSELDSVTALHRLCSGSVGVLINERWSVVQDLEAETRRRDSEIVVLKRELEGLRRENARMNKQIIKSEGNPSSVNKHHYDTPKKEVALARMTPSAFVEVFKAAITSVHEFAGWFLLHRWPPLQRVIVPGAEQLRQRNHRGIIRGFSRFCQRNYLAAVPSEMESAMFSNLEQRAFVSRGGHPRTWFYRAFATMARSAWALRVAMEKHCSASADGWGVVVFFYARRGSRFEEEVMQSVNGVVPALVSHHGEEISVAFSVTPGLKIGDTVVKCRVVL